MVTIVKAAGELGVSTTTVHRWLREGFVTGEHITPGAPWQIRLTDELLPSAAHSRYSRKPQKWRECEAQ
jgi:predicted site-specific integrase-resolvase